MILCEDWTRKIKENLDHKNIQFSFVHAESQLADILTKVVAGRVFHGITDNLSMIDIYAPTWGGVSAWAICEV
jgi:hypothetical protein